MAKYTMTLSDILKSGYVLWDFDYPCIAGYRSTFERKFNLEFHDREINFLSVDEFKIHLEARLNLIMPYYVQLQKSERLIDSPFSNFRMAESTARNDDEKAFINSIDSSAVTEGIRSRETSDDNIVGHEAVTQKVKGTEDGTLDRDTTNKQETNYTSHQATVEDTTEKKDTTRDTGTSRETTTNGTEDTTDNRVIAVKEHEDVKGQRVSHFSDTPQENFQFQQTDAEGRVISEYATTVTVETHNDTKDRTTDTKDDDTKKVINHENQTVTESVTETVNENTVGNRKVDFNQFDDTVTKGSGTQDDVTHGEREEDTTKDTQFTQNAKNNGQQATDREAKSSDVRKTDRITRSEAISRYTYEGYKNITQSQMLRAFRETFLNIDRQIFEECETLFLGVY